MYPNIEKELSLIKSKSNIFVYLFTLLGLYIMVQSVIYIVGDNAYRIGELIISFLLGLTIFIIGVLMVKGYRSSKRLNPYTWNVLSEEERRAVDQELTHGERIESCVLLDEYIVFPSSEGLTILRYKDIAWVFDYRKYRRRSLGFMRTIYFVDEVMIFDGGGYEHTALSLENGDVKHMMIRLLDRMSYLNLYPLIGYDDKLYSEVKKNVNVLRDAYWNNQKNR